MQAFKCYSIPGSWRNPLVEPREVDMTHSKKVDHNVIRAADVVFDTTHLFVQVQLPLRSWMNDCMVVMCGRTHDADCCFTNRSRREAIILRVAGSRVTLNAADGKKNCQLLTPMLSRDRPRSLKANITSLEKQHASQLPRTWGVLFGEKRLHNFTASASPFRPTELQSLPSVAN